MSLKVAELLATLGVDASQMDAQVKAAASKTAGTVKSEMTAAGKTGGDALSDGLADGAEEGMTATTRAIRDGERAAARAAELVGDSAGGALGDGLDGATSDLGDEIVDRFRANTSDLDTRARSIGGDAGDSLTTALESATADLGDGLEDRLRVNGEGLADQAGRIGGETGGALGDGILDGLPDMGGGLSGLLGDSLGGLPLGVAGPAAAAGAAIGVMVVDGFSEALDRGKINAELAARLNVDPATAEQFGRVTAKVWADNWGESTQEVADAIDNVYSTLNDSHLSEAALERLTKKSLAFAQVMDADVGQAVANAGVLIQSGLADNADQAFDLMTAAAQRVPAYVRDELADATHEYSTFFASLGYSGEEAFGTLVAAAEGGTYAIDKTGDAIKELSIRATDLNDTGAMTALQQLGMVPEEITTRLLAGGKVARQATREIIDALLSVEDPAKQAALATSLMGAPIEDLNKAKIPEFLARLGDVSTELKDVKGAADGLQDANKSLGSSWDILSRKGKSAFASLADDLMAPAAGALTSWDQFIDGVTRSIQRTTKLINPVSIPVEFVMSRFWSHDDDDAPGGEALGRALGKKQDAEEKAAKAETDRARAQEHSTRTAERAAAATEIFAAHVDGLALASEKAGSLLDVAALRADGFRRSLDNSSVMDDQLASALSLSEGYASFAEVIRDLPHDLNVTEIAFNGLAEKPSAAVRELLSYGQSAKTFLADTLKFEGEESTREAAARLRTQLTDTATAAGFSKAQIDELLRVVGVSDQQIEIAIKVSGDDLAITKIQLLKESIAEQVGANPEFSMFINAAIARGDFQDAANLLSAFTEDMTDGSIENPILLALGVDTLPATLLTDEWKADTEKADPTKVQVGADTDPATGALEEWWTWASNNPATTSVDLDTEPATEEFRRWAEALANRGITIPVNLERQVLDVQDMVDAGGYGTPYKIGTIEYARGMDLNGNGIIGRAAGGPVDGLPIPPIPGLPASDTILMAATPGEWVVPSGAVDKLGPEVMATVSAGRLPAAVMAAPPAASSSSGVGGGFPSLDRLADEVRTLARAVATRGDDITINEASDGYQTAQEILRAKQVNAHAVVG